jgi:hypothetical protein
MHGSMWRREETRPVGYSRAAQAPPADPTTPRTDDVRLACAVRTDDHVQLWIKAVERELAKAQEVTCLDVREPHGLFDIEWIAEPLRTAWARKGRPQEGRVRWV